MASSIKRLFPLLILSLLFLSNTPFLPSSTGAQVTDPVYWPTDDWLVSTPEQQGMSSAILNALTAHIADNALPVDSLLVVRHGYLVYEIYPREDTVDRVHYLASATKSVTSALVGIAIQQGHIPSVDTPVLSFFPTWTIANRDARKEAMTVEHLLNMQAGLEWDGFFGTNSDSIAMVSSLNPMQYVLDKPMVADPGTTWDYNSGVSHLLGAILRETAGQTPSNFGREFLFNPLGIDLVYWEADHTGLSFGSHGLSMRPRDMAKFGFLYLHDGEWDGQQIVPQAWVSQSRITATTAAGGYGYGYQWWQVPTLDIYMALGGGYQIIIVSQAQDLVMVMTANDLTGIMDPMAIVEEFVFGAITNQYISPLSIGLVIAAAIGIPVAVGAGIILWRRRRTSTPSSSGQTA